MNGIQIVSIDILRVKSGSQVAKRSYDQFIDSRRYSNDDKLTFIQGTLLIADQHYATVRVFQIKRTGSFVPERKALTRRSGFIPKDTWECSLVIIQRNFTFEFESDTLIKMQGSPYLVKNGENVENEWFIEIFTEKSCSTNSSAPYMLLSIKNYWKFVGWKWKLLTCNVPVA